MGNCVAAKHTDVYKLSQSKGINNKQDKSQNKSKSVPRRPSKSLVSNSTFAPPTAQQSKATLDDFSSFFIDQEMMQQSSEFSSSALSSHK
jgi:hypothetical protein